MSYGKHCIAWRRGKGGRRVCAGYGDTGGWGDVGLGDWGDLPLSLDTGLAPTVGGGTALITSVLLKAYAKEGGLASRRAGVWGALVGVGGSVLYGFARGAGAGMVSGIAAAAVGLGFEAIQAAVAWKIRKAAAAATPPEAVKPPELPAGGGEKGFIRAKVLSGYGADASRGYMPAIGSSPLDVLREHAGVIF